jgi:serine/threonine-protein kinase
VRLIIQVCHGLRAAHDLGLVHRDLKPENIFIQRKDDGGECAKILDFGVVQTSGGNSTAQTGALIGTLKYMAPEQARGDARLDQRADLYSLGAILYECLTGVPPHTGRNNEELLFHIMNEEPAPIRERRPELPAGVEKALLRSLHRSPEKRFQSAEELARALSPYAGGSAMSSLETVNGRDTGGSLEETLGEGGALATTARPETTSRRTLAAAKKYMTWIAVTILSGAALHALDRAWLLGAKPAASEDASSARIAAAPPPAAAPPQLERSSDTTAHSDSAALSAVVLTTKPSSTPPSATRPPRKTPTYASPSSTPGKPNAALRADSYSANLDWKNPYDSGERAQR